MWVALFKYGLVFILGVFFVFTMQSIINRRNIVSYNGHIGMFAERVAARAYIRWLLATSGHAEIERGYARDFYAFSRRVHHFGCYGYSSPRDCINALIKLHPDNLFGMMGGDCADWPEPYEPEVEPESPETPGPEAPDVTFEDAVDSTLEGMLSELAREDTPSARPADRGSARASRGTPSPGQRSARARGSSRRATRLREER